MDMVTPQEERDRLRWLIDHTPDDELEAYARAMEWDDMTRYLILLARARYYRERDKTSMYEFDQTAPLWGEMNGEFDEDFMRGVDEALIDDELHREDYSDPYSNRYKESDPHTESEVSKP